MKIIKLLYLKYGLAFSICLISSFIIFFIFSLFGNLNEDYLFNIIISISLLNSLQILMYVPSFIFLISVILLSILLRSKNEIIIIKSYMNIKKLFIFFLPLVLIFTILETNKKEFTSTIQEIKLSLININGDNLNKILVEEEDGFKSFTVLNEFDLDNLDSAEYRYYRIANNKIDIAQFSNNLLISNNALIANNYTQYSNDIIKNIDIKKIIDINFADLSKNVFVKKTSQENHFLNGKNLTYLTFSILLFFYIFLIFFDKKYVSSKQNLTYPIIICLIIIIYSFLIFTNTLNIFRHLFEILSCFTLCALIFKINLNE